MDDLGAWSLGLEYELRPTERAGLVLGYGHAFLRGSGVEDDGSLFLAGAHYDFATRTRLRASAGHRLRFPSIRQLYDPDGGNPGLESERCWCFEVGLSQRLARDTTLGVTGFWMELSDFIERLESGGPFENRQELRNRGVEIEAESRPWSPLFVRLAYSFLDAQDVSAGSPFDRLENRPRHKVDAILRYTLPWQTTLRAAFTFGADILTYSRSDPTITTRLDDFALLDLRVEQPLRGSRLLLYAGVENVLDQEWTYNYGFPQAGRTVLGGVELRL
jgi:outer membrane cobalamin receptor